MKRYSAELNLMNEAAYMMENPLGKWCKFADHEADLYMARADKSQTLMEAERAMAQIREATAKIVAERDAAVARMRTAINMLDAGHTKDQVRVWLEGYCDAARKEGA